MGGKRDQRPDQASGLEDEDLALWKHVTRDTKPLAKRAPVPETPPAKAAPKADKGTKDSGEAGADESAEEEESY